jgi:hypothetical protein
MTKPFTTRWNVVPSSTPALASRRNARTCSGALAGMNSMVIGPAEVSSTARYDASVSAVSVLKGSGSGGGVSRISTDSMPTRSVVIPSGVAGVSEMAWTTSMPSETRPKTVYLPDSDG